MKVFLIWKYLLQSPICLEVFEYNSLVIIVSRTNRSHCRVVDYDIRYDVYKNDFRKQQKVCKRWDIFPYIQYQRLYHETISAEPHSPI